MRKNNFVLSEEEVKRIAGLAKISLSPEQVSKFKKQLSAVLGYVEKLKEIDVSGAEPTSQVTGMENIFRKDEAEASLSPEEATANAKDVHNNLFVTPPIFENEAE